jgi:hypothetical protein
MIDPVATATHADMPDAPRTLEYALEQLAQRVQKLETTVAALPDARQIEDRVTTRVKASIPPPPPVNEPPSFKDIALPIPSVPTMVATAKTTWALFEMLAELRLLLWMLVDRRYHMAWLTRVIAIVLLAAIMTTHYWLPFAAVAIVGPLWEKVINLGLALVMFMMLHYEMRRYQQWRQRK